MPPFYILENFSNLQQLSTFEHPWFFGIFQTTQINQIKSLQLNLYHLAFYLKKSRWNTGGNCISLIILIRLDKNVKMSEIGSVLKMGYNLGFMPNKNVSYMNDVAHKEKT
jgi:hypothetical protein